MKKKVFSLLALVLFMSSSLNATIYKEESLTEANVDCTTVGLDAVDSWEEEYGCLTAEEATSMYNRWYAACEVFKFF